MFGVFFTKGLHWSYPLSSWERAGVRAGDLRSSIYNTVRTIKNGPHPNPLPRGEGTGTIRLFTRVLLLTAFVLLPGCKPAQPIVPDNLLPDKIANEQPLPSYHNLVTRYNATTKPLVRVWASARVDLLWLDENGKQKSEHGDGRFMYRAPDKIALEITEAGRGFWAGGDGDRYWFFDLQDDRTLYVGQFDKLDELDADTFPLPVRPTDLPYILGLLPIDPDNVPEAPAVESIAGHYLIEPPGLGIRMLLHPETARPVRVDLIGSVGESAVKCILTEPAELERSAENADGPAPTMAGKVEVYVLDEEVRMTLNLKGMTTDGRRIKDNHFDLDILKQVYKPDKTVDLDNPANPAP